MTCKRYPTLITKIHGWLVSINNLSSSSYSIAFKHFGSWYVRENQHVYSCDHLVHFNSLFGYNGGVLSVATKYGELLLGNIGEQGTKFSKIRYEMCSFLVIVEGPLYYAMHDMSILLTTMLGIVSRVWIFFPFWRRRLVLQQRGICAILLCIQYRWAMGCTADVCSIIPNYYSFICICCA
jgi:hypothetical protein